MQPTQPRLLTLPSATALPQPAVLEHVLCVRQRGLPDEA
jgi:hypothetical protein